MVEMIHDASTGELIGPEVLDPFDFPDYRHDDLMVTGLGIEIDKITKIYQEIVIHGVDGAFGDIVEELRHLIAPYLYDTLGNLEDEVGRTLPRSDDINTLAIVAACLLLEWNRL